MLKVGKEHFSTSRVSGIFEFNRLHTMKIFFVFSVVICMMTLSSLGLDSHSWYHHVESWNAYHKAISAGDVLAVKKLIISDARVDVRESGPWGRTLLHITAKSSHKHPKESLEIAQLLIKSGAMVNAQMRSGVTPLHEAARSGAIKLAKELIKNGALLNPMITIKHCLDPDYKLNNKTPLDVAVTSKNILIGAMLRKNGAKLEKELRTVLPQ